MKGFKEIEVKSIQENMIAKIGDEWMLVSAGNEEKFNTMTASWGGVGVMWGKSVAFVVIRPQRYTYEFVEKNDRMTLTFFGKDKMRDALKVCGTKSGRDCDKVQEAGLTAVFTENGSPAFAEAEYVMECKKLYAKEMSEDGFIERELIDKWFGAKDFHKMYIVEIEHVYVRE